MPPLNLNYDFLNFPEFSQNFQKFVMFISFSLFNENPPPPSNFSENPDVKQTIKLERPKCATKLIIGCRSFVSLSGRSAINNNK